MKVFELTAAHLLPGSPREVFPFFADAGNLEALTPPWLAFRILTPLPLALRQGALLDYRIRLHGLPIRWRTEITTWEPPFRFMDEQIRGPYQLWAHEHTFEEVPGGTRAADRVRYAVLGGALVNRLLVARDLRRIFEYRSRKLHEILGGESGEDEPMRIGVAVGRG